MKRFFFGAMLLVLVAAVAVPATAQVGISFSIGLPPPVTFVEPPAVVVLPDTDDVYVVPEIDIDLFFWNGWWWRPWGGRWYRSRYYDRGWGYYRNVPRFYFDIDPGWRVHYRDRHWYGNPWYYERIDHRRLQRNWQRWRSNRHWQREQTWGVQNYRPRPQAQRQELRQQRQREYQQRPEVQQYQLERQRQQRRQPQPQVQQPRQRPQERVREPQRQEQRPRIEQPRREPRVEQQRQEPQDRVQQPQRQERPKVEQPRRETQSQGKPEREKPEKQDRKDDDKR